MQEQREMWRLRELEKSAHWGDFRVREPRAMIARGRLLSDTLPSSPPPTSHRSHRRQTSPEDHAHHEPREVRDSAEGYWTRRLLKQEENDPGRWGHSGYRELYAEDFASSEDNDSEEEEEVRRPKPRGSENGSSSVKKKRKKEVSSVGSSKRKRRRGLSESTEDEEERKSRKKKRKLKVDKRGVKRKDGRKKSKHKHSQS
ncbi:hypothetical protein GBAR_LOCUS436 [Geodia barretti]|nr:hypothetical protein GBAR_LOCUS436 [Geodia barretti]